MTIERTRSLYLENLRDALDVQLRVCNTAIKLIQDTKDQGLRSLMGKRFAGAWAKALALRWLIDDASAPSTGEHAADRGRTRSGQVVYLFPAGLGSETLS